MRGHGCCGGWPGSGLWPGGAEAGVGSGGAAEAAAAELMAEAVTGVGFDRLAL